MPNPAAAPVALTCDFWNTLVSPDNGHLWTLRRTAVAAALAEHEATVDDATLDGRLVATVQAQSTAWNAASYFTPAMAADRFADEFDVADGPLRDALRTAYLGAGADAELELAPGLEPALRAIKAAGLRLGIICDVGLTGSEHLRAFLARRGLLELFDGWSFSDEVGAFKPDAAIFQHALQSLDLTDPSGCFHIGDLLRTDVAGARAAGFTSIRYTGLADDRELNGAEVAELAEADLVAADWAQVPVLLGIDAGAHELDAEWAR